MPSERRVRRNRPATYSEIRAPACTGGRSGSRVFTQPDAAWTVSDVDWRSRAVRPVRNRRSARRRGSGIDQPQRVLAESQRAPAFPAAVSTNRSACAIRSPAALRVALEIDCRAALSGVQILEETRLVRVWYPAGKRPPEPQRIARGRLDLADVGAEIDEQLRAVGRRDIPADLDDAQSRQRSASRRHSDCLGLHIARQPVRPPPSRPIPLWLNPPNGASPGMLPFTAI